MALIRYVTEMGMGTDVHGQDYTKAAKRAVSDAIRHSSLNFFNALGKSPKDMRITARIGVAEPEQLDTEAVAAELPYGTVTVECVHGGLDVPADSGHTSAAPMGDAIVIASAAIIVRFEE
ncbi:MAG TPA: hypothetical protein DE147_14100 [Gammaproteobacteria bacterium]|nr:hypothetical protein [Gammaproteobacteria bacterium]